MSSRGACAANTRSTEKRSKTETGNGVRLETQILLSVGTTTLAQPLPPADGKDLGEAAKIVERALAEALKGIPYYSECIADLRAQNFAKAEKNARLGLQAYKNSVLSRICLLQAQTSLKAPADSIIANAKAILAIDSTSLLALANLVDAYKAKGDTAGAVASDLADCPSRLAESDRSILPIVDDLVPVVARSTRRSALLEPLLKDNPFDGALLKKKWVLLMTSAAKGAPGGYKQAIAAGQAMVKVDTAEATVDYFKRQIGAAQTDSNAATVTELATQGSREIPEGNHLPAPRRAGVPETGEVPAGARPGAARPRDRSEEHCARRSTCCSRSTSSDRPTASLGAAQKMIAGGIPKDSVAASLSASRGAGDEARRRRRTSAPTGRPVSRRRKPSMPSRRRPRASFYIAWSSFQVAADILPHVQTLIGEHQGGRQSAGVHRGEAGRGSVGENVDRHAARRVVQQDRRGADPDQRRIVGDYITQVKKRGLQVVATVRVAATQPVASATGCVVSVYSASPGSRTTWTHRSRARARYMSLLELEYSPSTFTEIASPLSIVTDRSCT